MDNQLIEASEKGDLEQVKELIEQGANIHADNDYALRWASYRGHLDIAKYLIAHKANIEKVDNKMRPKIDNWIKMIIKVQRKYREYISNKKEMIKKLRGLKPEIEYSPGE